jgi:hypothetical protein
MVATKKYFTFVRNQNGAQGTHQQPAALLTGARDIMAEVIEVP